MGTTTLFVRFGTCVENNYFYVCEKLAAEYVLGAHVFDKSVKSIELRDFIVELDDGPKIPIIWKLQKPSKKSILIPENIGDSQHEVRLLHKVLVD